MSDISHGFGEVRFVRPVDNIQDDRRWPAFQPTFVLLVHLPWLWECFVLCCLWQPRTHGKPFSPSINNFFLKEGIMPQKQWQFSVYPK